MVSYGFMAIAIAGALSWSRRRQGAAVGCYVFTQGTASGWPAMWVMAEFGSCDVFGVIKMYLNMI